LGDPQIDFGADCAHRPGRPPQYDPIPDAVSNFLKFLRGNCEKLLEPAAEIEFKFYVDCRGAFANSQ